ncbi:MAG TPA: hypothetical protein VHU84_13275, partial [Lacipirellulaceae bacterium]|nr:hypothetical protein [Lacipirellulaceae bacterium]
MKKLRARIRRRLKRQRASRCAQFHLRSLTFEPLEARFLLTTFTVVNLLDAPNAPVGSLREALNNANANPGPDRIEFAPSLTGTLALAGGELSISDALTIAGPGSANLTIDAQSQSRIFDITATTGDVNICGLTVTNGSVSGDNAFDQATSQYSNMYSGGAIRSVTSGNFTIDACVISGSDTTGTHAQGGGLYAAGPVTLINSTI